MKIQVSSDNTIAVDASVIRSVEEEVRRVLGRFATWLTRVEIHLSDVDKKKTGQMDKRCLAEVRPTGARPLSASARATKMDYAVNQALGREDATVTHHLLRPKGKVDSGSLSAGFDGQEGGGKEGHSWPDKDSRGEKGRGSKAGKGQLTGPEEKGDLPGSTNILAYPIAGPVFGVDTSPVSQCSYRARAIGDWGQVWKHLRVFAKASQEPGGGSPRSHCAFRSCSVGLRLAKHMGSSQVEWAFDVNQAAKLRLAPSAYTHYIGLEVPREQLAEAFYETYGIPLREVVSGRVPAMKAYRFGARSFLPNFTYAQALLHKGRFAGETLSPALEEYTLQIAQLPKEEGWDGCTDLDQEQAEGVGGCSGATPGAHGHEDNLGMILPANRRGIRAEGHV